jgi:hypothetical protein
MTQPSHPSSAAQRYQVFVIGPNDLLRTPAGTVRLFDTHAEAHAAAQEYGGFVQPASAAPPGGFDRPTL